MPSQSHSQKNDERRMPLRAIAESTLEAIEQGSAIINSTTYNLATPIASSTQHTRYYAPDSLLSTWSSPSSNPVSTDSSRSTNSTQISILEISTLEGARFLSASNPSTTLARKIGVLNFASAKHPGGGFINGAQAQEESIARSSTLYPTLMTSTAQQFYKLHKHDPKGGYYSHAMIYSPGILLLRDDSGGWLKPLEVDVLTSPAVNAGVVRRTLHSQVADQTKVEERIEKVMRERMGRILLLFEQQGATDLVLGSFGTGVFRNNVGMVGRLWGELLGAEGSRFKNSFERVVFAVLGKKTFDELEEAFLKAQGTLAA